jgi:hypothetical protein
MTSGETGNADTSTLSSSLSIRRRIVLVWPSPCLVLWLLLPQTLFSLRTAARDNTHEKGATLDSRLVSIANLRTRKRCVAGSLSQELIFLAAAGPSPFILMISLDCIPYFPPRSAAFCPALALLFSQQNSPETRALCWNLSSARLPRLIALQEQATQMFLREKFPFSFGCRRYVPGHQPASKCYHAAFLGNGRSDARLFSQVPVWPPLWHHLNAGVGHSSWLCCLSA